MSSSTAPTTEKASIRARVWPALREVAIPDSRFHWDFSSFIADFAGSRAANDALLVSQPCFDRGAESSDNACVFIAPDNCLEYLREQALCRGVKVLVTSYGIRRGFWLLDPVEIRSQAAMRPGSDNFQWLFRYAATLDGMERIGRPVTLSEIAFDLRLRIDLMVTGTGAINGHGVRIGKGHGFFDLEWGMLHALGMVDATKTVTAAVVHDCQVLEDEEEVASDVFDTVCDIVVTPTRMLQVQEARTKKPTCGILWDRLEEGMLEDIPPLRELRDLKVGTGTAA